ncbi:basic salivary proline-rich protein 2-like [Chiroxiphia lanceolata]|uniref:basic salivary proline-rich protein 2-like n=1 Tax=Chiroxiphia lanceolata TaxID=296741 RepID=UPI0013CEB530|nr:basic salivary proline-rich protein 2-like [Chiroxiphia lanceolata]
MSLQTYINVGTPGFARGGGVEPSLMRGCLFGSGERSRRRRSLPPGPPLRPWARDAGRAPAAPPAEGAGRWPGGGGRRGEAAAGGDEGPAERMPPPRPPGSNFAENYRPRSLRPRPASPGRASNLMPQREPQPAAPPPPGLRLPPQQPGFPAASRCRRSPWPRRAWVPRRPGRQQRGMRRPRAP